MHSESGDDMAFSLAPEVEARLDVLLAGWVEQHAVASQQAETIRLAIVNSGAAFDAGWWQELFGSAGQAANSVGAALSALAACRQAVGASVLPVLSQSTARQPAVSPSRLSPRWT
ncbi:MAG TPA: hypothetical protein VIU62_12875 [Chloroflexota bacterium]